MGRIILCTSKCLAVLEVWRIGVKLRYLECLTSPACYIQLVVKFNKISRWSQMTALPARLLFWSQWDQRVLPSRLLHKVKTFDTPSKRFSTNMASSFLGVAPQFAPQSPRHTPSYPFNPNGVAYSPDATPISIPGQRRFMMVALSSTSINLRAAQTTIINMHSKIETISSTKFAQVVSNHLPKLQS
jgi:hypothetical protein